jgi:hypothetical protein
MPNAHADRNLLFGVLALQMDFISRDALVAAMNAWVLDKTRPLGDLLCSQKAIAENERALLDGLVRKHLEKHGNDPQQSLAALAVAHPTLAPLGRIPDDDLRASLVGLAHPTLTKEGEITGPDPSSSSLPGNGRFTSLRPHARAPGECPAGALVDCGRRRAREVGQTLSGPGRAGPVRSRRPALDDGSLGDAGALVT